MDALTLTTDAELRRAAARLSSCRQKLAAIDATEQAAITKARDAAAAKSAKLYDEKRALEGAIQAYALAHRDRLFTVRKSLVVGSLTLEFRTNPASVAVDVGAEAAIKALEASGLYSCIRRGADSIDLAEVKRRRAQVDGIVAGFRFVQSESFTIRTA